MYEYEKFEKALRQVEHFYNDAFATFHEWLDDFYLKFWDLGQSFNLGLQGTWPQELLDGKEQKKSGEGGETDELNEVYEE